MRIDTLKPSDGSRKKKKRIGRGLGSGHGKTATKGHKGQKSRSGSGKGPAFEGGQTPIQRRLPKRGFKNEPFRKQFVIVNVGVFDTFEDISEITPEFLMEQGIISKIKDGLKVLGRGDIGKGYFVRAHSFSESAMKKIIAAGGKTEVIPH